jgi:hypothetical protein
LQGSNDNTAWTDLDTQSNIRWNPSTTETETKSFSVDTFTAYRWYRLHITAAHGVWSYHSGVFLKGFQLYDKGTPTTVRENEVGFIYSFNPTHIHRVIIRGDAVFKDRVGAILTADTPETNEEWVPMENDLFEMTIPVGRMTDTIRLNLAAGENAIYDRLLIYTDWTTRLESILKMDVEVKTFLDRIAVIEDIHFVTGKKEKIAAGMTGSLVYQSEQSKKICRIDIVCDSNARARLLNEGFDWQEEDLGALVYWRGINILEEPTYITEYTFAFGGMDSEKNWIGEGVIFSTHFYEEVQRTEYDSPMCPFKRRITAAKNFWTTMEFYLKNFVATCDLTERVDR